MHTVRQARTVLALLLAMVALGAPGAALAREAAPQTVANLLTNGGFEGGATYSVGTVASGWVPWWNEGSAAQKAAGLGIAPTYEVATTAVAPNGVLEGNSSQSWKHTYASALSGVYQQVSVPANALVRFEVYGRGYSCNLPTSSACPGSSAQTVALNMQAGIDPAGRTDFNAEGIVKTSGRSPYDAFQRFSVEAHTGSSTTVTVFLAYQPGTPARVSQTWWDKATLTVISGGQTTTTTAGATTTPDGTTETTTTTETTIPEGAYVVQNGDSLFQIAKAHNTTATEIIALNSDTYPTLLTNPDVIYAGWVLLMPAGATTTTTTTTEGTTTTGSEGPTAATATPTQTPESIPGETYVVQAGDSLLQIARETGVSAPELVALNEDVYPTLRTQPDVIYVGWVLKLK